MVNRERAGERHDDPLDGCSRQPTLIAEVQLTHPQTRPCPARQGRVDDRFPAVPTKGTTAEEPPATRGGRGRRFVHGSSPGTRLVNPSRDHPVRWTRPAAMSTWAATAPSTG